MRPHPDGHRITTRRGVTILELLVVVAIMSIVAAMSLGRISQIGTQWRVTRAAQAFSEELQAGFGFVGRNRKPLIITLDTVNMELREVDRAGVIYRRRSLGQYSAYKLSPANLAATALTVEIYPPGLAANSLSVAITVDNSSKRVRMLRGGLVQVCNSNSTTSCP